MIPFGQKVAVIKPEQDLPFRNLLAHLDRDDLQHARDAGADLLQRRLAQEPHAFLAGGAADLRAGPLLQDHLANHLAAHLGLPQAEEVLFDLADGPLDIRHRQGAEDDDVIHPVEEFRPEMRSQLAFHGGMDIQHVLPFGSPAEVREEVKKTIRALAPGGGYILAPCHNIQPVSPPENIVALYETGLELGWTRP